MTFSITSAFASEDIDKTQDLPNEVIVFFNTQGVSFDENITDLQRAGWKTVSTDQVKVTWEKGVTAAVVASAIAIALATRPETIILAFGAGALSAIAGSSIGGTLYVEEQELSQTIGLPLRRYSVKLKDSGGDMHGPYYINFPRPRSAEDEMVEN